MTTCIQPAPFLRRRNIRQDKRRRMLNRMANWRAAKARKRQERIESGLLELEPKMQRWYPLEFGVRDKRTGETAWTDLRSVRHAAAALGLIIKHIT